MLFPLATKDWEIRFRREVVGKRNGISILVENDRVGGIRHMIIANILLLLV